MATHHAPSSACETPRRFSSCSLKHAAGRGVQIRDRIRPNLHHPDLIRGSSWITRSPEETVALGHALGTQLPHRAVVALTGDLGAGKTTLVKGIVQGVTGCSPEEVSSPTFTYLNIYEGESPLYHFDLYRIPDEETFAELGFDDFLMTNGVACIEWAEKIELPAGTIQVELRHTPDGAREIRYA